MKKVIFMSAIFLFACLPAFCGKNKKSDENNWQEVKDSGKDALNATGNFFKNLGKQIKTDVKETVDDITEIKCIGTWYFNEKKTVITINSDKTLKIVQKQKNETHFWSGTYSATLKVLTFTIEEQGNESWTVSESTSTQDKEKWYITYSKIDEDSVKFSCSSIPEDSDGNNFDRGQIFTK